MIIGSWHTSTAGKAKMKLSYLMEKLIQGKEKYGDIDVCTGEQGTPSFRYMQESDIYYFGMFDTIVGVVINENAQEGYEERIEAHLKKHKDYLAQMDKVEKLKNDMRLSFSLHTNPNLWAAIEEYAQESKKAGEIRAGCLSDNW